MHLRLRRAREALRSSLWAVPAIGVTLAILAAIGLVELDHVLDRRGAELAWLVGGSDSARSILTTIATAMLGVTGVVFSVTMLALQQAAAQLSPRVMRTFLRDWSSQLTLGIFLATFVYALVVLSRVRSSSEGTFTPEVATLGALALTLAAIAMFVHFIHHTANSLRPATVIARIGSDTRVELRRAPTEAPGEDPGPEVPLPTTSPAASLAWPGPTGTVTAFDHAALMGLAEALDGLVALRPMVGDHLVEGAILLDVWCRSGAPPDDVDLRSLVSTGPERTMEDDAAFGVRQLVDIAERALSPSMNDPATAIAVLDELHHVLRVAATTLEPAPVRCVDGVARLVVPRPRWEDLLAVAVAEVRTHAEGDATVLHRLRWMLDDLATVVDGERADAVARERDLVDVAIDRSIRDAADRSRARGPGPVAVPRL